MPRGKPGPKKSVHAIFEQFVSSLSDLVKVKVAEAVNAAAADFLTEKLGGSATPTPKWKGKYRRKPGPKPGSKRGKKTGPKPKAAE